MSKLVVVVFPNDERIPDAIRALRGMHGGEGVKLYGSAAVTRDRDGKLSVQEVTKEGHGGAVVGALIGALAGMLGGPLGAADLASQSADTEFVHKVSGELSAGRAAVAADVAEDGVASFEALMESIGGAVVRK